MDRHSSWWLHLQLSRSGTCEHSTIGGTGFGKPTGHNLRFIHCSGAWHTGSLNPWWCYVTWVNLFTQNELESSGHIHLQWVPQNVKCASTLEDYGFCILFVLWDGTGNVTHDDCIRLLAGRGMNICQEVWCLSTVMQPHTVYNIHKEFLQSCYWELQDNATYGADLAHWTLIYLGQ